MTEKNFTLSCPTPNTQFETIQLAHGGGGRLSQRLLEQVIFRELKSSSERHDGALLSFPAGRLAFTTDSYVIKPRFFPGGDIGKLAVYGTVNDLAMCGATPRFLSVGLILEEGLPIEELSRILRSMQRAAEEAQIELVTGDTKVVDRGKGDGIFINTSGIGTVPEGVDIRPGRVQEGDAIVLSGDIGRHGVAILSVREGLQFESPIESDCAPLHTMVASLLEAGISLHCLRDLTRGGLAAALYEISRDARVSMEVEEAKIPVSEPVHAACELLGLDPLYVANEGRMILILPQNEAERALSVLRAHPFGQQATQIGRTTPKQEAPVLLQNRFGGTRLLDLPLGEQLPRIC